MRNLKKFLALVLATMMLLSVAVISTSAADEADYTEAAEKLAAFQIMKGNENGDLMLDNNVTRYQAALFFVQALTGETETATWQSTKTSAYFSDVADYGTAIDYAYGINLIKGRGNGIYGYNDSITYQDMLVMAVRALGYETEDMSYPYGYILAAQKLGLTENVELVDYKAALNRGETAQIIWDMLDTEVAVIDPITDKILYPGEEGLTDALLNASGVEIDERETLMEQSDLAGDKIEQTITAFEEADEDDEDSYDTVTLNGDRVVAAADLGIDADTPKVNYLGLTVEMYISVDAEDFTTEAYEDGDAEIIAASMCPFENVVNLGDGNVQFVYNEDDIDKSYFNFGGEKLHIGKYYFNVAVFTEDGWDWEIVNPGMLASYFVYEDGEYINEDANTFANLSYRVTDLPVIDEITGDEYKYVEVLYTPLLFGQYNVRELKDRGNASKETEFATIATYTGNAYENYDEEDSVFEEVILGSTAKVTVNTTSVSAKNGEKAKDVTIVGETVEAGDFMFYAYNETDNILTVAKNCGGFETGRLNAKNNVKENVKISGETYEFGFAAPTATGIPSTYEAYEADLQSDYIAKLEPGKDNVKYILVDGKIVYMEECTEEHNDSIYDFAVISTDPEILSDLLNVKYDEDDADCRYNNNLSGVTEDVASGVYVADNGYMAVAVLSKTTGEWELGYIKSVELDYDHEDEEFAKSADVATLASYVDMFENPEEYKKNDLYVEAMAVANSVLVAVVDEEDGVYTIADTYYTKVVVEDDPETEDVDETETVDVSFFVYGETEEGILFNDNNAKTNPITCDPDVDPERVTLDEESVVIVVDYANNMAGARVGVQGYDNCYRTDNGVFLAASADLIALVDFAGDETDIEDWSDAAVSSSDETWYIPTIDSGVELENVSEDEDAVYTVTITDVLDLKTLEIIDSITVEVDDTDDALVTYMEDSVILHKKGDKVEVEDALTFAEIIVKVANTNEEKLEYVFASVDDITFDSDDTIFVPELIGDPDDGFMADGEAVDVNVKVVTLKYVVDEEDYDFSGAVLGVEYDEPEDDDGSYDPWDVGSTTVYVGDEDNKFDVWTYFIDGDMVEEINEPTEGIFDNYITAVGATLVYVPEDGNDDYADAMEAGVYMYAVAAYEAGVVNVTVYKIIVDTDL